MSELETEIEGNTCFLFHKWSKWSEPEAANATKRSFTDVPHSVKVFIQKRKCKRCGKVKLRSIPIT